MEYQLFIDHKTINQHVDFLMTSDLAEDRTKAIQMVNKQQKLNYTMNQKTEIVIPTDIQEAKIFIQKLKFFHNWTFYHMMGIEFSFIKDIIMGQFTFSQILFKQSIHFVASNKQFSKLFEKWFKPKSKPSFYEEDFLEVHNFVIPLKRKENLFQQEEGQFEINFSLIDSTIRYIQFKIINIICQVQQKPGTMDPTKINIKRNLWNQMGGYQSIVDVQKYDNNIRIPPTIPSVQTSNKDASIKARTNALKEFLLLEDEQSPIKNMQKENKLSIPQYYATNLAIFITEQNSPYFLKFHKLSKFQDFSYNKSAISNDEKKKQIAKNIYIQQKKGEEEKMPISYESQAYLDEEVLSDELAQILYKDPFQGDQLKYQLVPCEAAEVYPLTYEQYATMQMLCSHFMRLNDFLRTEKFINKFFDEDFPFTETQINFLSFPQVNVQEQTIKIPPKDTKELQDQLYKNLPLVNEALISPHTQLINNYDRLEMYGDSIISLFVIFELYLTRTKMQQKEDDLDKLKKQRISNESLIKMNILNEIYKYMMIEPQSQPASMQVGGSKLQKNTGTNIMRNLIPGGLGDHLFQEKLKNIKIQNYESRIFKFEYQKALLLIQQNQSNILSIERIREFEQLFQIVFCKKPYKNEFQKLYPDIFQTVQQIKKRRFDSTQNDQKKTSLTFEIMDYLENKHNFGVEKLKIFLIEYAQSQFEQSNKQLLSQEVKATDNVMEIRVYKDKKMADSLEALVGAVMQICGIKVAYQFARKVGITQEDLYTLEKKTFEDTKTRDQQDPSQIISFEEVQPKIKSVQQILNYKFNSPYILLEALTDKSYSAYIKQHYKKNINNYNLLEFLGDSILNFIVLDFFYQNSRNYPESYSPKILHKLKTEIVNNNFLALIMIENGIHNSILIRAQDKIQRKFEMYAEQIINDGKEKQSTKGIFQFLLQQNSHSYKENFMDPKLMSSTAKLTSEMRLNMEDYQDESFKVYGDVFEALVAAVFLDSGADLGLTQKIFMNILEPYLYVYGNTETIVQHPRTEIMDFWARSPFSNILKDKPIQITHLNEIQQDKTGIVYTGYLGGSEVLKQKYEVYEKNKMRKFFKVFKEYIEQLIGYLNEKEPKYGEIIKKLQIPVRPGPGPKINQSSIQSSDGKIQYNSLQDIHFSVINHIYDFTQIWKKQRKLNTQN